MLRPPCMNLLHDVSGGCADPRFFKFWLCRFRPSTFSIQLQHYCCRALRAGRKVSRSLQETAKWQLNRRFNHCSSVLRAGREECPVNFRRQQMAIKSSIQSHRQRQRFGFRQAHRTHTTTQPQVDPLRVDPPRSRPASKLTRHPPQNCTGKKVRRVCLLNV